MTSATTTLRARRVRSGFSLIELVIVIVIIGIIAAIAIPRMSRGSQGATEASLRANIAVLTNAIELFITEHEGTLPSTTAATFVNQLTKKTDVAGTVGTVATTHIYGPYIREIPKMPVEGQGKGQNGVATTGTAGSAGATIGWIYTVSGTEWDIQPNTSATATDGTNYRDW